jgi:HK97 family phage prohead protease
MTSLNTYIRPFEIKSLSDTGEFEGYASTYTPDNHRDLIMPGAFQSTLQKWQKKHAFPPLLWQHQTHQPIGRFETLVENDQGLHAKGHLLRGLRQADEAYALLKTKAISGLSIGFRPIISRYDARQKVRKIFQVDLAEVSVVSLPANPEARVYQIKSLF